MSIPKRYAASAIRAAIEIVNSFDISSEILSEINSGINTADNCFLSIFVVILVSSDVAQLLSSCRIKLAALNLSLKVNSLLLIASNKYNKKSGSFRSCSKAVIN